MGLSSSVEHTPESLGGKDPSGAPPNGVHFLHFHVATATTVVQRTATTATNQLEACKPETKGFGLNVFIRNERRG
ncbi:hypothetical protein BaRGS_00033958 [Batillaria attramentaria]|uniref:Uncharacterized protein n=1 Tax=Batillaria attramentaria TaxID=370345 RepID=A0ABD0JIK2_9CAEN